MSRRDGIGLERYSAAFEALHRGAAADDPQWVQALRREAMSRFMELGLPTARRGNEDWKYTDVRPITRVPFQPVIGPQPAMPDDWALDLDVAGESGWDRMVFVDGVYMPRLSSLSSFPNGVLVTNLDMAIKSAPDLLESHLARHAGYETHAFTALNTAFAREGAFIYVPDGAVLEKPIQILYLSAVGGHDMVTNPRSLVLVGKGSVATIIESYASLTDDRHFTNGVTEIVLEPGAILNHYRVQCQSEEAYHIATTHVVLDRDSTFSSFTLDLGGSLARNNLHVLLDGEGSSCALNGIYVATRSQHVDNQVFVDHAKPHTTSRELYKGILNGRSRAVFHGSINVRQNAQKVDARQENRNLLLSDQAEADTKPAFWIYADDVKCSHGASCGKMNDGALFYLRSRGIDEEEARRILIQAFVTEVIDTIGSGSIRSHVGGLVTGGLRTI
jgi:Fe-S cluster assembly protein SufD